MVLGPIYETLFFSHDKECAVVVTQGRYFILYRFVNPTYTRFDIAQQNDTATVPVFNGQLIKKYCCDPTTDFTLWGITKDLRVISGEGDWRQHLSLNKEYTIKELFKMINEKLDDEAKQ